MCLARLWSARAAWWGLETRNRRVPQGQVSQAGSLGSRLPARPSSGGQWLRGGNGEGEGRSHREAVSDDRSTNVRGEFLRAFRGSSYQVACAAVPRRGTGAKLHSCKVSCSWFLRRRGRGTENGPRPPCKAGVSPEGGESRPTARMTLWGRARVPCLSGDSSSKK